MARNIPLKKRMFLRYQVGDYVAVRPGEVDMFDALVWIARITSVKPDQITVDWYELDKRGSVLLFKRGRDPCEGIIVPEAIMGIMPARIKKDKLAIVPNHYLHFVKQSLQFFLDFDFI